jgi:hypothetical protein
MPSSYSIKNGSRLADADVRSIENEEKNLVTGKSSRLLFPVLLPLGKTAAVFYVSTALRFMRSIGILDP